MQKNRLMWGEKPYHSLDYEMKQRFGEKVYKIALDGGMTCPNRDGTIGRKGCIFCSGNGSGDFASPICESVTKQIDQGIAGIRSRKTVGKRFIAYFQSFTNTYAPVERLRQLYKEALSHPDVAVLSIATRPDCINHEVLSLLEECNQIKPVMVELGLQTIHEETARFIRRGYPLSVFDAVLRELKQRQIETVVHVISGLPLENKQKFCETIEYLSEKSIDGIKLQLLHVLKNTDLAFYLGSPKLHILEKEEYFEQIAAALCLLPPETVIHRLTGDGPKESLLAPLWSSRKREVLNELHRYLKENKIWQSKEYHYAK